MSGIIQIEVALNLYSQGFLWLRLLSPGSGAHGSPLVGDQLEQHQLQLAGVEDAPRPAASFAMLAVAAEAMATAMAEMTVARAAMIAGKLERLGLVRSGVTGPPAEASAVVAVVAAPVAPALVVAVGKVGEAHYYRPYVF